MSVFKGMSQDLIQRKTPMVAWVISLIALAVPATAAVAFPNLAGNQPGVLIWLLVLVPVFLLTHYRGLPGAAVAIAATAVALLLGQVLRLILGSGTPDWSGVLVVVTCILIISIGIGIFGESLHRERREAESLALADQLTGLPNRRHLEIALDREFGAALRGRKLGVVVYDIDHFKLFNDTFGHAVGDDVLRTVGSILQQFTRRQNISARYGGEEFISVVSDVDNEGMLIFANRVREAIKNTELPWGRVSVSGGVALYRDGMGSHEVLVAAADRALYAAKEAGRDRVEVATDEAWAPDRPSKPRASVPYKQRRVLVVDSEPDVRQSISILLKEQGFITEETGSAQEAANIISDAEEPFDVLVTSVTMPRSSGFTLVDQLTTDTPDLRIIYLSDSLRERVSWPGVPGVVHRFVPKPIDRNVLLETINEALAEEIEAQ